MSKRALPKALHRSSKAAVRKRRCRLPPRLSVTLDRVHARLALLELQSVTVSLLLNSIDVARGRQLGVMALICGEYSRRSGPMLLVNALRLIDQSHLHLPQRAIDDRVHRGTRTLAQRCLPSSSRLAPATPGRTWLVSATVVFCSRLIGPMPGSACRTGNAWSGPSCDRPWPSRDGRCGHGNTGRHRWGP